MALQRATKRAIFVKMGHSLIKVKECTRDSLFWQQKHPQKTR